MRGKHRASSSAKSWALTPSRIVEVSTNVASKPPNDQAQQRRGLLKLQVWEIRRAPAVGCSAWFGVRAPRRELHACRVGQLLPRARAPDAHLLQVVGGPEFSEL